MTFPDNLGIIGMGDGKVVFPAPEVQSGWNDLTRSYKDGEFRWGLVTGVEPIPSLGYQFVEPVSYRLEITPDLGWPNTESMFEPYIHGATASGNALLRVIKNIQVGSDIVVQSDESGVYTIDEDTMRRILAPGFENYLWRVMAVSAAGHAGHPSSIQAFRGRVVVVNIAWTVREPDSPARAMTATVSGTREASVTRIEVNGEAGYTTFLTPDTWQAEVPLGKGRNVMFLRAFDSNGNGSEYRQVDVEVMSEQLATREFFNRFDDFGYLMGLKRLPGERNHPYRERIKDVLVHRGGTDYPGLMNAIPREIGVDVYDQALLLNAAVNPQSQRRWTDVSVWLNARHFCVRRADAVIVHERNEVEGRTWQVRTSKTPAGPVFQVESPAGTPVHEDTYRVDSDKDGPYIQFLDREWAGRAIWISYQYVEKIPVEGKTIDEMVDALNALEINGAPVLEVTKDPDLDGDLPASCLQKFPPAPLREKPFVDAGGVEALGFPVRWVPFELNAFMDPEFIERFRNDKGSLFGTQYGSWAYGLKSRLKTTWGYLVADEGVWSSPTIRVSGIGSLPLVYDAYLGSWVSEAGGYAVSPAVAVALGLRDSRNGSALRFDGVDWERFWSGKGYANDMLLIVDLSPVEISSAEEEFEIVRQIVEGEEITFEELGIGQNEVDSNSEVS